jgi:hypothetical protein
LGLALAEVPPGAIGTAFNRLRWAVTQKDKMNAIFVSFLFDGRFDNVFEIICNLASRRQLNAVRVDENWRAKTGSRFYPAQHS